MNPNKRSNKSRQTREMVQKQNLNAPGTMAEYSARQHDAMDNRQFTGASGPDSRLKPWWYGLGYETLAFPELSTPPDNALPAKPGRGSFPKPKGKGSSDGVT